MRIGELRRRTGATLRALRYYEKQGLVVPSRHPNGYRDYAEVSVSRDLGVSRSRATSWSAGPRSRPSNASTSDRWRTSRADWPSSGTNIAKIAAARELLALAYYGLRDGHIRCLATTPEAAA